MQSNSESSVLFFGMSRGGSSVTFQILQKLLTESGYVHIDIEGDAYRQQRKIQTPAQLYPTPEQLTSKKVLAGPYRSNHRPKIHTLINSLLKTTPSKIVIITRDPVDCLYSWFFAKDLHPNWSNKDVKSLDDIDKFVIQLAPSYLNECSGLIDLVEVPNAIHFSYSDIALHSCTWLRALVGFLKIHPSSKSLAIISNLMSFLNPYEDVSSHRRSGIPGEARQRLKPETCAKIDRLFADFNQKFQYPRPFPTESEIERAYELSSLRDAIKILTERNGALTRSIEALSRKPKSEN